MNPIVSILIHVPDWRTATPWYAAAFPSATRIHHQPDDFGHLALEGVAIEIVNADDKVACGAAGSVVYWRVDDLHSTVRRLEALGARLYRGPLAIEGGHLVKLLYVRSCHGSPLNELRWQLCAG